VSEDYSGTDAVACWMYNLSVKGTPGVAVEVGDGGDIGATVRYC